MPVVLEKQPTRLGAWERGVGGGGCPAIMSPLASWGKVGGSGGSQAPGLCSLLSLPPLPYFRLPRSALVGDEA